MVFVGVFTEYSKSGFKMEFNSEFCLSLSKIPAKSQAPVSHAYNPSYSGGGDQEDHSLKPAPGK
jgi:hypothetical protein